MPTRTSSKSLTMIEVMAAAAVFAVIAVSLYSLMRSGTLLRKRLEKQDSLSCAVYLNLEIIAREVRNSFVFKPDAGAMLATVDNFSFYTRMYDYKENSPYVALVTYQFKNNALYKSVSRGGESCEEYIFIDNITEFKFAYYNYEALIFEDIWKDKSRLPGCVKVDLAYGDALRTEKYIPRSGK